MGKHYRALAMTDTESEEEFLDEAAAMSSSGCDDDDVDEPSSISDVPEPPMQARKAPPRRKVKRKKTTEVDSDNDPTLYHATSLTSPRTVKDGRELYTTSELEASSRRVHWDLHSTDALRL
jgi:hypothetical protein